MSCKISIGDRVAERLVAVSDVYSILFPNGKRSRCVDVICDCGVRKTVRISAISSGSSKSCGCLKAEILASQQVRTGKRKPSDLRRTWWKMIGRCECATDSSYADYGGRGITVCHRWRNSFTAFSDDMGPRPSRAHSIDRIDNDGNYEPGNCRWATKSQQNRNTRRAVRITVGDRTLNVVDWALELGVPAATIYQRVRMGLRGAEAIYGARVTHCQRGHEFSGDNVGFQAGGRRLCRSCRAQSARQNYLARRARAASGVVGKEKVAA